MSSARVPEELLQLAEKGRRTQRSYGALALGLICRAIGSEVSIDIYGEFQERARAVLRAGLASKGGAPRGRAAFAIALGLARDEPSVRPLAELVADTKLDRELRGYAAVALGHIGIATPTVLEPVRRALRSRTAETLRRAAATALGMLRDHTAVPLLLEELHMARTQAAKGQSVVALARVGDERAIEPLVTLLRDEQEQALTRALACAGLGIVGDLEWLPSLSLLYEDINYRASGPMIAEVLSIL